MRGLGLALPAGAALLGAALLVVLLPLLQPASAVTLQMPASVPPQYIIAVQAAAASCVGVPAAVLAAQLEQESGWRPDAVSPKGAVGLAQFLPATWARFGTDADGNGLADPRDPLDAIAGAARYDCYLRGLVGGLEGDPVALVLAAYNAGPGAVLAAGGVPDIEETRQYVEAIMQRALGPSPSSGADGLTPEALRVRELVRQNFGITEFVGFARSGHVQDSDHYTGRAIDVMLTPMGSANTGLGWRIALYLQANARELSITYLIWQGRIWSFGHATEGWRPYRPPSGLLDPTHLHMDHVHVSVA